METWWNTVLWRQMGAAIDMLENALVNCPDSLWRGQLWSGHSDPSVPPEFAEFWYRTYHTIFWLDLYLSGCREADFAPPAPFAWMETEAGWALPEQPYTKEQLRAYLLSTRQKAQTTLLALTDEQARRTVEYSWGEGQTISFWELQLYSMRHVQEHAAQLSLFLGQHSVPDEVLDWVGWAKDEPDGH